VIHTHYLELEKNLSSCSDIEKVAKIHQDFLDTVLKQCYLNQSPRCKTITRCLDSIFQLCFEFSSTISKSFESGKNDDEPPMVDWSKNAKLASIANDFTKQAAILKTILITADSQANFHVFLPDMSESKAKSSTDTFTSIL
jgi:hypothetical protein